MEFFILIFGGQSQTIFSRARSYCVIAVIDCRQIRSFPSGSVFVSILLVRVSSTMADHTRCSGLRSSPGALLASSRRMRHHPALMVLLVCRPACLRLKFRTGRDADHLKEVETKSDAQGN